jgi:hypothetical protein
MTAPGKPGDGEVYIEFVVQAGFVKATAIDPRTGAEASVMGPAGAARSALADAAMRKLTYIQKKERGER